MSDYIILPDKRVATATVLQILSIPHEALFRSVSDTSDKTVNAVQDNKNEIGNLLSQVYQFFLEYNQTPISLEILWITHEVENQPYRADIELFIISRSINHDLEHAKRMVTTITEFCKNSLSIQWYDFREQTPEYLSEKLAGLKKKKMRAVVKEERMQPLPFKQMQHIFTFDIFKAYSNDFRKLTNTLINYPGSALIIQLMPTKYDKDSENLLLQMSQSLSTLASSFRDSVQGQLEIITAQQPAALYSHYTAERNHPLFDYNIVVAGDPNAVIAISSRVIGTLNEGVSPTDRVNTKFVDIPVEKVLGNPSVQIFGLPWHISALVRETKNKLNVPAPFYKLSSVITVDECCSIFGLPIANSRIGAGLSVNETSKNSKKYSSYLVNAGDIELGYLKSSKSRDTIGLALKDLAKHMLIVGTPGSGKTTFSVGLLDRLWKEHKIPFLVIEPAKNEYRAMVQSIPDLQVFTPGKDFISPFVFNPFVPPKNVKLETYKSTLKTAFAAGVTMTSPLDKIFEETINNCYSDFRWLNNYTIDDCGRIFNIMDFIKCFQETFDEIGYTGDARNIGRAGLVRLKSLVNLFDNYFSIPIEDILTKPTVIELAAIENADQKALIIALILLSILSYVNTNYVGEGGLRNFILLEEAHVLLDSSSNGGEGAADPAAIAQGLVKRMLAEIRSYGVGLGIADQSPRKVGIDIVALTDIKMAFRLVENKDKQIMADSTSMSEIQLEHLAKLKPGEAFLFFNRLDEPEEIVTPDYRLKNDISISLSDEGIRDKSTYWKKHPENLRPYPECRLTPYCDKDCDNKRKILAKEIARRLFKSYIGNGCKDSDKLKNLLKNIRTLIKSELNVEPFSEELLSCVKVYLWRHIKYDTKLDVPELVITNSLKK